MGLEHITPRSGVTCSTNRATPAPLKSIICSNLQVQKKTLIGQCNYHHKKANYYTRGGLFLCQYLIWREYKTFLFITDLRLLKYFKEVLRKWIKHFKKEAYSIDSKLLSNKPGNLPRPCDDFRREFPCSLGMAHVHMFISLPVGPPRLVADDKVIELYTHPLNSKHHK